jgi:hypothetical protein
MIHITDNTNLLISDLNEKLKTNCPDLQLTVFPKGIDFKLCLLNNNVCVSYLTINDYNGFLNILSQTNDEYQGRGYNKFLTAVSIYLADTMTEYQELNSSTSVKARIHILSQYKYRLEEYEEDGEDGEDKPLNFFIRIDENKNKAENIITEWIQNKCVKNKANVEGGGNKTRRNKQRRKSKRRKSKRRKTKRFYK